MNGPVNSNLYLRMEEEREKVPRVLRQNFIPSFVISLLREKLGGLDSPDPDSGNKAGGGCGGGGLVAGHQWNKNKNFWSETEDKWTDDSLLEDFAELEGSLLFEDESALEFVHQVLSFGVNVMDVFEVDRRKFVKCFMSEVCF